MAKSALLVGINRYRLPGAALRGCLNDVGEMRGALIEVFGFPERGISVLVDLEATKSAIQKGLESLVRAARPGDVVLIHYSGHGSSVHDVSGDEADSRDEILCPSDLDWRDPLLDDWLRALFDTVADGVNLTVVMDCCFSGTNTRATGPLDTRAPIERFLPCPPGLLPAEAGPTLRGALRKARKGQLARRAETDVKDVSQPEILLSSCRDDETCADAFIDDDFHGVLTYALVRAIRETGGRSTYRDLHRRAARFAHAGYSQTPQLEGRARLLDRPFLSPFP